METQRLEDVRCQCCGMPGDRAALTITGDIHGKVTILCSMCERLIDDGFLRPETVDGRTRYRQWHLQPMTPGELLDEPRSQ
jgi:hypothetical protein